MSKPDLYRRSRCVLILIPPSGNSGLPDFHVDKNVYFGVYSWNSQRNKPVSGGASRLILQTCLFSATTIANAAIENMMRGQNGQMGNRH